jgi:glycosyltransferase involved in cell wall biosynthesis
VEPLNIFYEEPDIDRWIKYDRYPRRVVRRIVRGKPKPGGHQMVAINLMKGLDKLGIPYRFNDFKYIKKNPDEIACLIGKPYILFDRPWANPIILGASVYAHASEEPELFTKYPNVKRILVPGEWMRKMFEPYYGEKVTAWPVGTDTEKWRPANKLKTVDFLIYDKVMWNYDKTKKDLLEPIINAIENRGLSYECIRYGHYYPAELAQKLAVAKAAIFLCEHESQGLAYQQILSVGIPILAWNQGGYWQDPLYYPEIKFGPVSSVPYWDERCGLKFSDIDHFDADLSDFLAKLKSFKPRDYIIENLSLEQCAKHYLSIYQQVKNELNS